MRCNVHLVLATLLHLSLVSLAKPLLEPLQIRLVPNRIFQLSIEYCPLTVYNDSSQGDGKLIISLMTRCYCFDPNENQESAKIVPPSPSSLNHHLHYDTYLQLLQLPLNSSSSFCSVPGPTLLVSRGDSFTIRLSNHLQGTPYDSTFDEQDVLRHA